MIHELAQTNFYESWLTKWTTDSFVDFKPGFTIEASRLLRCKMSEEESARAEQGLGTKNETTKQVNEGQKLIAGKMHLKLKQEKALWKTEVTK